MISNSQARDFCRICQETLGFLNAYGFSAGQLSGDPLIHSIVVRFYGKSLTVECIWDTREEALEVKIARLRDGKPPTEFAVNASGQRVRDHLTSILLRSGTRVFGFRKLPPQTPVADRWRWHLEDYARLLQQQGQAILKDDPGVLA